MGRITWYLPALFLTAGLILLGVATWAYFDQPSASANALEIDRSALDQLAATPLDPGDYDFTLRITNTTNQPQRVVGFTPT